MEKKFKRNQLLVLTRSVTICCTVYPQGTIVKCLEESGVVVKCFVNKREEIREDWAHRFPKSTLRPLEATEKFYAKKRWEETSVKDIASVL